MKKTIGKLLIFILIFQLSTIVFAETLIDYTAVVDESEIIETSDFESLDKVYAIFEVRIPSEYEKYLINESYLNIDTAGVKRINVIKSGYYYKDYKEFYQVGKSINS